LEILRENLRSRREDFARKQQLATWKAEQKWLQTEYPTDLAQQLAGRAAAKTAPQKLEFRLMF
jgi:hypothetical protein